MTKRWFAVITLMGALAVSAPLMADHGQKRGKGNPHEDRADDRGRHDRDRDDDRWERRDGYEYRAYGDRDGRPPGWSRGQKTGWRNCGLPPGQAKKYGCYTYVHEGRRYYYYHDDGGRIIVRRPRVQIHVNIP